MQVGSAQSNAVSLQATAESTCDNKYGTALEWAASPTAAAQLAKEQDKLVFVIHISGNFARPEFT